jgi:hypothetical protein
MKTLQITEKNARRLYATASAEFRTTLEDTFGKEFFFGKITDRIKTYEDACEELGEQPINEKMLRLAGFTEDEINYRKIKTITKALNEGCPPDYTNDEQPKWFPWFKVSSSGFVFDHTYYRCSCACAGGGSRLCLKNSDLAEYAGKQFTELYRNFIL